MDLGPTILELAGVPVPPTLEAISLAEPLAGKPWSGREHVFAEQARDNILTDTEFMTMVRSQHWKLVHFLDEEFGQLFDLQNDPEETDNLWGQATHADAQSNLLAVLREWRIRSQYETADWCEEWR